MKKIPSSKSQEILPLFGKPSITHEYELQRALEARDRRRKRKGELALNPRTRGFMSKVNGLWIPSSGTESSAVIMSPDAKLIQDKLMVRQLIKDKYEKNESISPARIRQWGNFAARNIAEKTRGKQYNYIIEARFDFVALCSVLDPKELTYDGEQIRASETALGGVTKYILNLRAFVGADRKDTQRRQWLQERWVNKRAYQESLVREKIDVMPNQDLEGFFDEAVYSAWSRELYWQECENERKKRWLQVQNTEPEFEPIPLEVLERMPENSPNYTEEQ